MSPCVRMSNNPLEWKVGNAGVPSAHHGESGIIMGLVASSTQCEVLFPGGVYMWERPDNPATLHSPAITTQLTTKLLMR